MHSRQSLRQLSIVWADDAAAISTSTSEAGRHFAQGCALIDRLLDAVRERDEEIDRLHAALRRQQEKLARTEGSPVF
ncbi:MAG: hypothetical protein GTO28_06450 [Gammaproteobacteria bacterium]|nr:hypothetical protein [Gammaproteobacteria bacterium]NIM72797.1 hypothetical protein [Gammaproteobacteria bacterium]NIO24545.1 hypothetical protein [Gammaproteobacteria bacterium]NIO65154.1 hypothetical protein [Gammaproteobacteria bacterium]NIP45033.1 hypothetical protein [Gammaproteobacteria bacterium]